MARAGMWGRADLVVTGREATGFAAAGEVPLCFSASPPPIPNPGSHERHRHPLARSESGPSRPRSARSPKSPKCALTTATRRTPRSARNRRARRSALEHAPPDGVVVFGPAPAWGSRPAWLIDRGRSAGAFLMALLTGDPGYSRAFDAAAVPMALVHGWRDEDLPGRCRHRRSARSRGDVAFVDDDHRPVRTWTVARDLPPVPGCTLMSVVRHPPEGSNTCCARDELRTGAEDAREVSWLARAFQWSFGTRVSRLPVVLRLARSVCRCRWREFDAPHDADALYAGTQSVDWPAHLSPDGTMTDAVAWTDRAQQHAVRRGSTKDAIVDFSSASRAEHAPAWTSSFAVHPSERPSHRGREPPCRCWTFPVRRCIGVAGGRGRARRR